MPDICIDLVWAKASNLTGTVKAVAELMDVYALICSHATCASVSVMVNVLATLLSALTDSLQTRMYLFAAGERQKGCSRKKVLQRQTPLKYTYILVQTTSLLAVHR